MSTWRIDPAHSGIVVSAKHMMITTVRGSFRVRDGVIELDESRPETARVEARIDAASVDTGNEQRDAHLRSPDFLDAEQHPHIEFHSRRVERLSGQRARVHGDLAIRGTTRPITLETDLLGIVPDGDGARRAAFHARGTINREEWGLTWNMALEGGGWLVSKELQVEIDLAAVEQQRAQRAAA